MASIVETAEELKSECIKIEKENIKLKATISAMDKEDELLSQATTSYIVKMEEDFIPIMTEQVAVIASDEISQQTIISMSGRDLVYLYDKYKGIVGYGTVSAALQKTTILDKEVVMRSLLNYVPLSSYLTKQNVTVLVYNDKLFNATDIFKLQHRNSKTILHEINRKCL